MTNGNGNNRPQGRDVSPLIKNISVSLTGILGHQVMISVKSDEDALEVIREYGRRGYTSGEIPPGGLIMPLSMADTFDFHLIGAREFVNQEGEKCVFHKGQAYKRRDLEAVDTKKLKMPPVVKYSRGAKPTDPPHLKEGDEGGVQYVTLITFKGNGRPIPQFQKPEGE